MPLTTLPRNTLVATPLNMRSAIGSGVNSTMLDAREIRELQIDIVHRFLQRDHAELVAVLLVFVDFGGIEVS